MIYDYLIVGAGSAGCVLANRLSENPGNRVLLLEAGLPDRNPFIHMPKGFAKVVMNPKLCWYYPIETQTAAARPEVWIRGKMLGGTSSLNGLLYVRGLPRDFDEWAERGAVGWGWSDLLPCYRAMEDHALGATAYRGAGGPLHVSIPADRRQPAVLAFVQAAVEMGIPFKEDFNAPGDEGVGYFPQTVRAGRRVSAADAFLAPARKRSNLRIVTGIDVEHVVFAGRRATGVSAIGADGVRQTFHAKEVILCAGAINTPRLLQLSGIGPPEILQAAGIDIRHASPGVGANMREHRYMRFQFRLKGPASCNGEYSGVRLAANVMRYFFRRSGVLASGAFDAGIALKTQAGLERPDVQINMVPVSIDVNGTGPGMTFEKEPGIHVIAYPMRPESRGSVAITSADPAAAPRIRAAYLTDERDRDASVRMVDMVRRLFAQPALRAIVAEETMPGAVVREPADIVATLTRSGGRTQGSGPGQHASSTCAMGVDAMAVVDPSLRVIGVEGLRVMDCSILPAMISGNTNAPVMAMAWRAADIILGRSTQN